MCTQFGNNEKFTSQIIHFAAFSILLSGKSAAAAVSMQYSLETIQDPCIPTLVMMNKLLTELFNLPALISLDPHMKFGKFNEPKKSISSVFSYYGKTIVGGQISPLPSP